MEQKKAWVKPEIKFLEAGSAGAFRRPCNSGILRKLERT